MTITINGTDYTNLVIAPSVEGDKNANYQNEFSFQVMTNDILVAGMELVVTDGGSVFGGIIQKPEKNLIAPTKMIQTISAKGYKQILARRTFVVDMVDDYGGETVESLFDNFLVVGSATSEEFTKGTIDQGAIIPEKKGTFNGYKLFTELATTSGLRWWVDDSKVFYFTSAPAYTTITKEITDDNTSVDKFELLTFPKHDEDLSKYRNRQYFIGKDADGNELIGLAVNSTEEARMSALYGSGVYGNQIYDNDVSTQADADNAAAAELNANSEQPESITIRTRDYIDVNQKINVDMAIFDIVDTYFIVDNVKLRYENTDQFLYYEATLIKALDTAKQKSSWTDDWNQALKNQTDETVINNDLSGGGNLSISTELPASPAADTAAIDTDDYSNGDTQKHTASATISLDDGYTIYGDGTITLSLPDISTLFAGTDALIVNASVTVRIVNRGTGTLTITAVGGTDTFNGSTTHVLSTQYDMVVMTVHRNDLDWAVG